MDDEYLLNNLIVYIEKEIVTTFNTDSIIVEYESIKKATSATFLELENDSK